MQRSLLLIITLLCTLSIFGAPPDEYDIRQAERYTREAEYYQKKAENYRREAQYYVKEAERYQREVAYYTRHNKPDRARDYTRKVEDAMDRYRTQMRYAANADERAADYLKRAARLLDD